MAVDFELTAQQRALKYAAREFAREVLRPVAERADAHPDPQEAFRLMKPVYEQAVASGLSTMFLPREYGGGGASTVDFLLVVEELCAVDPGFPTVLLVNGLALMPILWWGTEIQRDRWLRRATDPADVGFLAGFAVSERGGTANFDDPSPRGGIQVVADHDRANGEYVLHGEKHWPCNAGGWDLRGADVTLCVVRTDRNAGGTGALSAILVERGTDGVDYEVIDTMAHRTCQNVTMTFRGARVPEENVLAVGEGDLLINRSFTWSGPIAAIAAVGLARGAYEFTLDWARTYTGGGSVPIIAHQAVGYLLTDIAARIEAARYFAWKAAHYMDRHPGEGQALGGMNKTYCSESMQGVVNDCMRVVGVNALDRKFPLARYYREAAVFSLYDAGNLGMQRRRAWGEMTGRGLGPDTFVDDGTLR
ncbi:MULTISPECIES: acyl-CoA dehydrogenase family protein [Pseudonocardia]|uniref:Acryloyl-CoA reductase (NADH) n=2 Tax=Pseudonocardia TaxID=1847 RepID=A0A1Y2MK26_PSEAH|nr:MULTISPECIES: acyl-CoA dehydrogenase family protein [Pseudonocardia]OSY35626.1 Acryloyl-CoA reductase (NADH) [Pseudonocardia autotrophica]TDN76917.1 alkylation response protein AidB-like acyl-CoA dehydrogenase [Pseudonocardia autotrophica]BBG00920.1 acyl-CoA dehydrogenase [Pseudonocardia autotrophica]GEC27521.1 acyl-CoA dehydrogenase [Pseudonocardia saturnea]